ncbi:UNVERIFIED_CONTAM: hypothetical protein PYX00_009032 [Menopon gallinae]|uniref:beta-glucosidase n=1 Tax=Menopon gallinae TaxID=328185 RepID=A0AAW2H9U4_9NEOP
MGDGHISHMETKRTIKYYSLFDYSIVYLCVLSLFSASAKHASSTYTFPDDFLLGFSTASYQIEGGWNADGKGENIWDTFTHAHPEMIKGGTNGDIAADSYHKYKEDVQLLKNLRAQVYRFSLSWSRILPTGDVDVINQKGIQYYNNLINELIRNEIQPMVTLYHWDLPEPLQELGGWTNPILADYFEEYARIAFEYFGDRVKLWVTINEPLQITLYGYGKDGLAPALNRSGIAEYLAGHTLLISHARAYHLYDTEFRQLQGGQIGISLDGRWQEPASNSTRDIEAAETQMQFEFGWFGHPILKGDYPEIMRQRINSNSRAEGRRRSRLPVFDREMIDYIKGTVDFLGLNHYTTKLVSPTSAPDVPNPSWERDTGNHVFPDPSWRGSGVSWLKVVPWGFRKHLNWIKEEYNNIPVIVTENGFADNGTLEDYGRIDYHKEYIEEMLKAIHIDECNVRGYIAWSLIDNFEWRDGYEVKFGVYSVDFDSANRTRTEKLSVDFFRKLYGQRILPLEECEESNAIPKIL